MSKLTQKAIVYAFRELLRQKPLDKITVKDIIEATEINRNTFYYHFENIDCLLDYMFELEVEEFQARCREDDSFYDEYRMAFSIFLNEKPMIKHAFGPKSRPVMQKYMETAARIFIGKFVRKAAEGTGLSGEGVEFIASFYSYSIIGYTLNWFDRGLPPEGDSYVLEMSQAFEATVNEMIRSYISTHNAS